MSASLISTRDASGKTRSYTDVLLEGLAPDGGLFVPAAYPVVSLQELTALKDAPYEAVALFIKGKLVGDAIPAEELETLVTKAYGPAAFTRENGQVVPVKAIEPGLLMENLSLGPTASFKDMALQLLGREMEFELARRGEQLTILGATSGDTGSAAEAALKGLGAVRLVMLSPETGMSAFQKAQMGALSGGNILNVSIRGKFDDCQDLVKAVKNDPEFAALGAVNSINWGRISAQVPYYFSGYLQTVSRVGDPVDFVVPSGNFGNAFSGYVAKRMGLPIRRIVIATNENAVLDTLVKTGVYQSAPAATTSSPSMDISKASNYERLVFDILGRDPEKTAQYMQVFAQSGKVSLADFGVETSAFTDLGFVSGRSTHAERLASIKYVYEKSGMVIDPHTADAVTVARGARIDDVPMVVLSTALPVKFEDTVKEALGFVPERPSRFTNLEQNLPDDSFTVMDPDADELKQLIRSRFP